MTVEHRIAELKRQAIDSPRYVDRARAFHALKLAGLSQDGIRRLRRAEQSRRKTASA